MQSFLNGEGSKLVRGVSGCESTNRLLHRRTVKKNYFISHSSPEYEKELAELNVQKDCSATPSPTIGKNRKSTTDTRSVSSMDTLDPEPSNIQ